jgi:hypothetical protein
MHCELFPGQVPSTTLENDMKVWAPGYDMFLRATENRALLEDKTPLVSMDPFVPVLDARKEFWMKLMDQLPQEILQACSLDTGGQQKNLDDLLRVYHSGTVFLLLHLPSQVTGFSFKMYKTLQDALESESFWDFNPLLLVSTILWSTSMHDKADEVLEGPVLSAEAILEALPFLERPEIQESDVFCEEAARDFVNNALHASREPASLLSFVFSTMLPHLDLGHFALDGEVPFGDGLL